MPKLIECTLDNIFNEDEKKLSDGRVFGACICGQFIEVEPRSNGQVRKELHTWKLPGSWATVFVQRSKEFIGKKMLVPIIESVWEGKITRKINPHAEIPIR